VGRPATGVCFTLPSASPATHTSVQWCLQDDIPATGGCDGDGKADVVVFRSRAGIWYALLSSDPLNPTGGPWGVEGDAPITALTRILRKSCFREITGSGGNSPNRLYSASPCYILFLDWNGLGASHLVGRDSGRDPYDICSNPQRSRDRLRI